ncbi:unnamed protein product [Sphagnum balticum]
MKPSMAFERLGQLMNASHKSCAKMYQCSCTELDELTEACRKAGAYGSRLTGEKGSFFSFKCLTLVQTFILFLLKGAGWGGCAVSLIAEEKLDEFLESIRHSYYSKNNLDANFNSAAFPTKPSDGIHIVMV